MRIDYRPLGSRKLEAFVGEHYGTVNRFCSVKGLDRFQVSKAVRGKGLRVSVDLASDLEIATCGEVKIRDWVTPPDVRDAKREERGAAIRARRGWGPHVDKDSAA